MNSPPVLSAGGFVTVVAPLDLAHIPVRSILIPDNHSVMNLDHIGRLTRILTVDPAAEIPPVLLTPADLDLWWLVEGRHRLLATIAAGRDVAPAVCAAAVEIR